MLKHFLNGNTRRALDSEIKEAERMLLIAEGEVEMREHLVREAKSSAQAYRDRIARLSIHRVTLMTQEEIDNRMASSVAVFQ